MNSKELLEMLGEIDQDIIEDAAPSVAGRERVRKKATNYRMRIAAIAACCALLVLGVVMLLSVLDITQKPAIPRPDVTDETEVNETEKNMTDETVEGGNIESDETVSGQEVIIPSDTGNATGCPTEQTPPIESEFETEIGFSPEITAPQDTGNFTESPTEQAPPIEGEQENDSTECETQDCESETFIEGIMPDDETETSENNLNAVIIGDQFNNCKPTNTACPINNVGDKLGEIKMTVNRIDSDVVYQIDAEVNIVVGMNRDIYLCYRYIDNGEDYDFNIDYDTYYYMVVNDYKAASLFELKEKIIDGQSVKFDLLASYYKNTWDHYCPSYLFEEADLEKLVAEIFKNDCLALDKNSVTLESVKEQCEENVSLALSDGISTGTITVYDSGYICFSMTGFDDQLFDLGKDSAGEIIDYVLEVGEPQGYVWCEEEQRWYIFKKDENAEYRTFKGALVGRGIIGKIEFDIHLGYLQDKFPEGTAPEYMSLDKQSLARIAEILNQADGEAMWIYKRLAICDEEYTLVGIDSSYMISVMDTGYVMIGADMYYIGTRYTDPIFAIIRRNCYTPIYGGYYYYWDETNECWDLKNVEEDETERIPPSDEDYEYDYDYGETETVTEYETEIVECEG